MQPPADPYELVRGLRVVPGIGPGLSRGREGAGLGVLLVGLQGVREEGPDHDKTFWVSLKVDDVESLGSGKSKKAAEQEAARVMLEKLEDNIEAADSGQS